MSGVAASPCRQPHHPAAPLALATATGMLGGERKRKNNSVFPARVSVFVIRISSEGQGGDGWVAHSTLQGHPVLLPSCGHGPRAGNTALSGATDLGPREGDHQKEPPGARCCVLPLRGGPAGDSEPSSARGAGDRHLPSHTMCLNWLYTDVKGREEASCAGSPP